VHLFKFPQNRARYLVSGIYIGMIPVFGLNMQCLPAWAGYLSHHKNQTGNRLTNHRLFIPWLYEFHPFTI